MLSMALYVLSFGFFGAMVEIWQSDTTFRGPHPSSAQRVVRKTGEVVYYPIFWLVYRWPRLEQPLNWYIDLVKPLMSRSPFRRL
jgi:hypothetical protein